MYVCVCMYVIRDLICLSSEKLFAGSVVRSLSDLTMIANDEDRFSSGSAVLLYGL